MCPLGTGPDGSSGQVAKGSPKDRPLGQCFRLGVPSAMSLRDVGGEEECFECDCQDDEKAATAEQLDALDILEEGKFYVLLLSQPFLLVSRGARLVTDSTAVFYFSNKSLKEQVCKWLAVQVGRQVKQHPGLPGTSRHPQKPWLWPFAH